MTGKAFNIDVTPSIHAIVEIKQCLTIRLMILQYHLG